MSPLISFLKSPKLTETTCRDGTCSVRLWEPCWILLWAFGSLQLFTDTQQLTLTSEQGRHARETETGGKEMSNSLFSEIPSDNLIFPFPSPWWLVLPFPVLSVWFQIKLSIYFFFLFNLPCLYLVLLIQRLCSLEGGPGWLTFKGKGRFCQLFLQDQTWFWSGCQADVKLWTWKRFVRGSQWERKAASLLAALLVPSLSGPPHLESDKRCFESSLWLRHSMRWTKLICLGVGGR